jgi:hypothetical protein
VSDIEGQERPSQGKNGKSDTHKIKPTKGKKTKPRKGKTATKILVPSKEKGWHHRSVLGEVERKKYGHSKTGLCVGNAVTNEQE